MVDDLKRQVQGETVVDDLKRQVQGETVVDNLPSGKERGPLSAMQRLGRCLRKEGEWEASYVGRKMFEEGRGMGGMLC